MVVHKAVQQGKVTGVPRPFEGEESFEASLEARPQGGVVRVSYRGPLARHVRPPCVRFGERRGGQAWLDTRDVPMTLEGDRAVAVIPLGPAAGLEGACLAFFAYRDGATEDELVWDNAGRALGYYDLDFASGRILRR